MNVITTNSLEDTIRRAVTTKIEEEARKIADEYKNKALADLEIAVRKAVTETAVEFSRMIHFKSNESEISFTIKDERKSK